MIPHPTNEAIKNFSKNSPEKLFLKKELDRQLNLEINIPLVIQGKNIFHDTSKTPIYCPHRKNKILAYNTTATEQDIQLAIKSSVETQKEWGQLPFSERAGVFLKAADLLATKYRDKINAATMLAQSKTCFQAEIDAACELIDFFRFNVYFAQKIYDEQPMYSPFGQWNRSVPRGLEGFVFAIGPFNFTSISINLSTAPALMGCGVLWKPAPQAALASYYALEMLEEAGLPPGVINLVQGDPQQIGGLALQSKHLAGVHFTGSSKTFNSIWSDVGKNISSYQSYPRLVGETGGKDFVFAHPSSPVEELVTALIRGSFEYQGQKCSAASRAYIPQSLWGKVKPLLIATCESLKMGDPLDFSNFITAVIDQHAFKKITSYIEHAKSSPDAKILCGGSYDDTEGYFIRPTVIEAKTPHYKSMVEEIFGPVLTIYVYADDKLDETLALCDTSTPYALTGSIFAKNRNDIHKMTNALAYAAGNFYINDKPTGAVVGQQPFGGARASGTNDKAGSMFNLLRWVSHRTIKENFLSLTNYRYPFMEES